MIRKSFHTFGKYWVWQILGMADANQQRGERPT